MHAQAKFTLLAEAKQRLERENSAAKASLDAELATVGQKLQEAVAAQDFAGAANLKAQAEELQAQIARENEATSKSTDASALQIDLASLEEQLRAAVETQDFSAAAQLSPRVESLRTRISAKQVPLDLRNPSPHRRSVILQIAWLILCYGRSSVGDMLVHGSCFGAGKSTGSGSHRSRAHVAGRTGSLVCFSVLGRNSHCVAPRVNVSPWLPL